MCGSVAAECDRYGIVRAVPRPPASSPKHMAFHMPVIGPKSMDAMPEMFCIIAFRVHEHVRVHVEHGVLNLPERG